MDGHDADIERGGLLREVVADAREGCALCWVRIVLLGGLNLNCSELFEALLTRRLETSFFPPPYLAIAQGLAIRDREGAAWRLAAITVQANGRRVIAFVDVDKTTGGVEHEAVAAVIDLELESQALSYVESGKCEARCGLMRIRLTRE